MATPQKLIYWEKRQLGALLRSLGRRLEFKTGSFNQDVSILHKMVSLSNCFRQAVIRTTKKNEWCREVCAVNPMARRVCGKEFYDLFVNEFEVELPEESMLVHLLPGEDMLFGQKLLRSNGESLGNKN
jgi:hypothetical protein